MKKYLLATACDSKCENFLVNHWYKSLEENVNLKNIDILVVDFGLSKDTYDFLARKQVIVRKVKSINGHIVNLRFKEILDFLVENPQYEQVLVCDSGDMIFQRDFSHLFEIDKNKIKGVIEDISFSMEDLIDNDILTNASEIKKFLRGKRFINLGFVIYPRNEFVYIINKMFELIKIPGKYGTDMAVLNYLILQKEFTELEKEYNFNPIYLNVGFYVKDGRVYDNNKNLVAVVHNAGGKDIWRPFKNFGYCSSCNKPRKFSVFVIKTFFKILNLIRKIRC